MANGTRSNDSLIGTNGNDQIHGRQGDDTIDGAGGNDGLRGGRGADLVSGGSGNDSLRGGAGVDLVSGGAGNDRLDGNAGDDTVDGGDGNDTADGGIGNDLVIGGAGNDDLDGNAGNDTLDAGAGNDTADGGAGNDLVTGGVGNDDLSGNGGDDTVDGGDGNDSLDGGAGADSMSAGAGNDRLDGNGDDDTLDGGAGNDTLDGGAGNDRIVAGAGNDSIGGSGGNDTLTGGTGNDQIDGGAGADQAVLGGARADYSLVQSGNAWTVRDLNLSDGDDGTDTLRRVETVRFADGVVTLGGGANTAPVAHDDIAGVTALEHGGPVQIAASDLLANDVDPDAGDTRTFVSVAAHSAGGAAVQYDSVTGQVSYDPTGAFDALGTGDSATDSFTYTMRDAAGATSSATVTITVEGQNDAPVAYDAIIAVDAEATYPWESKIPEIVRATDAEGEPLTIEFVDRPVVYTLEESGNPHDGTIFGEDYRIYMDPGTAADRFTFRANDGQESSNLAETTIRRLDGSESSFTGLDGNDIFFGTAARSSFSADGGDGEDRLAYFNGADNVTLRGGGGEDLLVVARFEVPEVINGAMNSTLVGGSGNDIYYVEAPSVLVFDSTTPSAADPETDQLSSSLQSGLTFDFSLIDAVIATPGDDAFTFIGDAAFSAAGQMRYVAGSELLEVNVDDDLSADLRVTGVQAMQLHLVDVLF